MRTKTTGSVSRACWSIRVGEGGWAKTHRRSFDSSFANARTTSLRMTNFIDLQGDDLPGAGRSLAKNGGDQGAAEEFWVGGEVVGGDFWELLLDEDEGSEVEALDFGAGLHVVAGDGSAECG